MKQNIYIYIVYIYELVLLKNNSHQKSVFVPQELCKEFHRCETMLEMSAPKIFKRYDYNSNGSLEYRELVDVLRHLQNQFGENFMEVRGSRFRCAASTLHSYDRSSVEHVTDCCRSVSF